MLDIAVDARPLTHDHTGISIYLREILERLVPDSPHRWHLYADRPIQEQSNWQRAQFRTGNSKSKLMSSLYAQAHFGRWAKLDRCDLFWSPRHQLPLGIDRAMPTVVTLHDLVFDKFPETMTFPGRILERALTPSSLDRASRILTTSQSVKAELIAYSPMLRDKTFTVPLASDIDSIPTDDESKPVVSVPYFIYCGSIEPRKNLSRLFSAFLRLKQLPGAPKHRMVIVSGGGWKDQDLRRVINSHPEHFDLHTNVSEEKKASLIRRSDFLVLPSLYEGFGLPLVEALRLGTPILTSNRGAMAEIAGSAALLIDPNDQNELERGLRVLCNDSSLRQELSKEARKKAKGYSWDTTAQGTLQVLLSAATQS